MTASRRVLVHAFAAALGACLALTACRSEPTPPAGRPYVGRARGAGDGSIDVVEAPEAGHFELVEPGSSTWPLVLDATRRLFARIARIADAGPAGHSPRN